MDTQWQCYQVFDKERADQPFRNAGSVHAPDDELALENARDVFARRPECVGMWVVPERVIHARTAQELESGSNVENTNAANPETLYRVFQKQGQVARETYVVHVGEVWAVSPEAAMARAVETLPGENVFVWWVVPSAAILESDPADRASMFDPARTKRYRNHLSYPVESILRTLRTSGTADE